MDIFLTKTQTRTLDRSGSVTVQIEGKFNVVISRETENGSAVLKTRVFAPGNIKVNCAEVTKSERKFVIHAHFNDEIGTNADTTFDIEVNEHLDEFEDYEDAKQCYIRLVETSERLRDAGKFNQFTHLTLIEVCKSGKRKKLADWKKGEDIKWLA